MAKDRDYDSKPDLASFNAPVLHIIAPMRIVRGIGKCDLNCINEL
jgi:hypothetical protein